MFEAIWTILLMPTIIIIYHKICDFNNNNGLSHNRNNSETGAKKIRFESIEWFALDAICQ